MTTVSIIPKSEALPPATLPDADPVKTCSRCHISQPAAAFGLNPRTRDGYQSWCRQCHREYALSRQARPSVTTTLTAALTANGVAPVAYVECRRCGNTWPHDAAHFRWRNKNAGTLTDLCRDCVRTGRVARKAVKDAIRDDPYAPQLAAETEPLPAQLRSTITQRTSPPAAVLIVRLPQWAARALRAIRAARRSWIKPEVQP